MFGLYDAFETLHMKSQEWWLFSASHTSPANPAELTLLRVVGMWGSASGISSIRELWRPDLQTLLRPLACVCVPEM